MNGNLFAIVFAILCIITGVSNNSIFLKIYGGTFLMINILITICQILES